MTQLLSPTELRKNLYRVLDRVLETGVPQEIARGDRRLLIVPTEVDGGRVRNLDDLPRREGLLCSVEELIECSDHWEWNPDAGEDLLGEDG